MFKKMIEKIRFGYSKTKTTYNANTFKESKEKSK